MPSSPSPHMMTPRPRRLGLRLRLRLRLWRPPTLRQSHSPFPFKVAPPLHDDFARVKLSLVLDSSLLCGFSGNFSGVAPAKVVEFPKGVDWEDEIPDREGEKVDQHPEDVGPAVGGQDD